MQSVNMDETWTHQSHQSPYRGSPSPPFVGSHSMASPLLGSPGYQWRPSPMFPASAAADDLDFDRQLTKDFRPRPHSPVSPSPTITYAPPPRVAISVPVHNNTTSQRQDVHSVLNSSASFRPPSPAPRFHGFSHSPLESPLSSFAPDPHHVSINTDSPRLRTSQVFSSAQDLAAHYGIPQNLPPPPRPLPRNTISKPNSNPTPPPPAFSAICSNYLNMLSTPTDTPTAAADTATIAPGELSNGAAMSCEAFEELLASPEFTTMGDNFDSSPLFEDAHTFGSMDAYLTSPMPTPLHDFDDGSPEDSPYSDFLTTPVLPEASDSDMLTGALVDDLGYGDMSLFGGLAAFPTYEVTAPALSRAAVHHLPGTPSFDTIDPTTTVFPKQTPGASSSNSSPSTGSTLRRRNMATGTRRNLKPESLIPVDAPTQKRTYVMPSATSRKAVPAVFASKKRAHSVAFGGDDEELGELSPTASEQETIEFKRRQNTLAARKSRKRKLEHQQMLEEEVAHLKCEVERWRTRAEMGQQLLQSHGVPFDGFDE
ncbi:hypothetical protein B0H10DRAFT_2013171 [Mycena sp. CBHHK59/15]|nr:hypothetical protein B0H10DRAFT_2013171 [Mycena sp. CBHHK59/15]